MTSARIPHILVTAACCLTALLYCTRLNFDSDTDDESPVITLLGPDPYLLNIGDSYNEPGVRARDNQDGDFTA